MIENVNKQLSTNTSTVSDISTSKSKSIQVIPTQVCPKTNIVKRIRVETSSDTGNSVHDDHVDSGMTILKFSFS